MNGDCIVSAIFRKKPDFPFLKHSFIGTKKLVNSLLRSKLFATANIDFAKPQAPYSGL